MIVVRLRDVIKKYEQQTGRRITYAELARRTGLARSTIETLATRTAYNTTLATLDKLCGALGCPLNELIEYQPSQVGKRGNR